MQQDATVCICHKQTRDLGEFTRLADILVVAAGVPASSRRHGEGWRRGDRRGHQPAARRRIVGDVDFEGVRQKASLISAVPVGSGR